MKVASGNVLWRQRKRNWCRTPFTFTVDIEEGPAADDESGDGDGDDSQTGSDAPATVGTWGG